MAEGPKNDFLRRRQQQMSGSPPPMFKVPEVRFCPFSIRPPVESAVVSPSGEKTPPQINASPCLGPACIAFTVFQPGPDVQPIGECRLCMLPNMIMDLSAQLDRIAVAKGAPVVRPAPVPAAVSPEPSPSPSKE